MIGCLFWAVKLTKNAAPDKHTGWPTKMSLFFFGNNFYKNKETFKVFYPQVLKVIRIIIRIELFWSKPL